MVIPPTGLSVNSPRVSLKSLIVANCFTWFWFQDFVEKKNNGEKEGGVDGVARQFRQQPVPGKKVFLKIEFLLLKLNFLKNH